MNPFRLTGANHRPTHMKTDDWLIAWFTLYIIGSRGVFMAGVFAGMCFCITHPIESVKTRVQVQSAYCKTGGFFKTALKILRSEGIAS